MELQKIISLLPYRKPFLFADVLHNASTEGVHGSYTFPADADFYAGHFPGNPVTPGVLITEVAAQIGLVCLGILLLEGKEAKFVMSASKMDFLKTVLPGETVWVRSKKIYFRFGKLKCAVTVENKAGETVAEGIIEGIALS